MTTETQAPVATGDGLLKRISQTVTDHATVTKVFGEPIERNGVTVIPVARVYFGFGGGAGGGSSPDQGEGSGSGGGGGGRVRPVGYIEMRDGAAQFKRITDSADVLVLAAAASLTALAFGRLLSKRTRP
jgi:uncharacterized spore protein YtfJ